MGSFLRIQSNFSKRICLFRIWCVYIWTFEIFPIFFDFARSIDFYMAFMAIFLEFANSNCKKDKWRIHGFESLINPFLFLSNSSQFHFQSFSLHFRFRLYFFLIKNQYSFLFDFWCRMEQQDRPIYFIGSRALMIQPKPRKKSNKQTYSLVQLVLQDHFLNLKSLLDSWRIFFKFSTKHQNYNWT